MMWPFSWIHAALDWVMLWMHLIPHRQVGWKSLNRKTGELQREQIPILKKLKLLLLFNPLTEWIDTTHAMRMYIHRESVEQGKSKGTPQSHNQIKGFVDFYNINMDDFEPSDTEKYRTFEDFFVRKHKPGSRPIAEKANPKKAVCVADSRVVCYDTVGESKKLWIKGTDFSITNLVMDVKLGARFNDAAVASFRLSPQDYHRFHCPVSGTVTEFRSLPGDYYQVDPVALRSGVNILTANAREYVLVDSPQFGEVLFCAIGATNVGTVYIHEKWQKPGGKIEKGDELGFFQFGGSSIIVAFKNGSIKFDDDLLECSKHKIQVSVEVGMSLGEATQPTSGEEEDRDAAPSYADVVKKH